MHISPNDDRKYRSIVLENKLTVLLIQDNEAPRSAAALSVKVGHFDDPESRPGMAHFLEHMLFLGTKKYPIVGDFHSFINTHGGSNNAWTGTENTTFYFDISHSEFEDGLDRFGQFFYAPLFNEEAVDKERMAVDSEYKMKLKDDVRRVYQVHKETINPSHPFSKFSVGNNETLADTADSSIRDEMLAFYQQHYSSDLMTIAILGNRPLDELEFLAIQSFSDIPNNNLSPKKIDAPYITKEQQGCWINIKPLKAIRKLILAFHLPNQDTFYKNKSLSYIAHLLGHEGEGSLMLHLKKRGYIESLTAGGGSSGTNFREFTLSYHLTEKGVCHRDDIIAASFQYIQLIKQQGVDEWRYNEKKAVLEATFNYQEKAKPLDVVHHLVMNLQHYEIDDAIYGDYMMENFDQQEIHSFLERFTPEKMQIRLVAKGLEYDRKDKWYKTPYSVVPFSNEQLALWNKLSVSPELSLPKANPYIDYDLLPQPLGLPQKKPLLIEELPGFRLWHKQEDEFNIPKGRIHIAIDSPHSISNPKHIVKTQLCIEMFMDILKEKTYQAQLAGMSHHIRCHQGGVTLVLSGFSQKQSLLLDLIIEEFLARKFDPNRFATIKEQLNRRWSNAAQDRPISQLFNALSGTLQPNNPPFPVLLEALEDIQVDELPHFVQSLLAELHVEMFVYGDWNRQQALNLGERLKEALRIQGQTYKESYRPLVLLNEKEVLQRELFCDHADSALLVYYQAQDETPKSFAHYILANHLISASFFHELRTKQQLGYMVGSGHLPLNKHSGLILYIQSPITPPKKLLEAIDEFLHVFHITLLELTESQWSKSKKGLIAQFEAPDTNLYERAKTYWRCIGNKDLEFNKKEQVTQALKELTRADMIRFIKEKLSDKKASRLILHSQGKAHQDDESLTIGTKIESIDEFHLRSKDTSLG